MNSAHRNTALVQARADYAAAKKIYDAQPKFNRAKKDAAERMEWAGNRVAFLLSAR